MDKSRRDFLKKTGCAALGIGFGLPLIGLSARALAEELSHGAATSKQWGLVIDIQKCRNEDVVRACTKACRHEHNIPEIDDPEEEIKWIWTEPFEHVFPDQTHARTKDKERDVIVLCNHCTRPSCVRVCPTGATWKRKEDGIVMMDMHRCIGCRYCMAACPYSARSFNWRDPRPHIKGGVQSKWTKYPTRTKGVVEKCNFCAERLREGRQPACVEAAESISSGALNFGRLDDPDSEVSRILDTKHTISRRLGLGTGPNVFYIL